MLLKLTIAQVQHQSLSYELKYTGKDSQLTDSKGKKFSVKHGEELKVNNVFGNIYLKLNAGKSIHIDKKTLDKLKKDSSEGKKEDKPSPKQTARTDNSKAPSTLSKKLKVKWKLFNKEQKKFFGHGHHKAKSKERRTAGQLLKDKAKGIVKAIKHEVHEWKTAASGIKALLTGKKLDHHQKKAIKAVAIHTALVATPMLITGGLSAGLTGAMKGMAVHFLEHTAIMRGIQIAAFASVTAWPALAVDKDLTDTQALNLFVQQFADSVSTANITDQQWADVMLSQNKES